MQFCGIGRTVRRVDWAPDTECHRRTRPPQDPRSPMPQADTVPPETVLDARDLICPMPVLRARKALRGLADGAILRVEATDVAAATDIPAFCKATGHRLLSTAGPDADGVITFRIRKTGG